MFKLKKCGAVLEKGILKIFAKFTGKHMCRCLFLKDTLKAFNDFKNKQQKCMK